MPSPTPLRPREQSALANPVAYSVARFRGHAAQDTVRRQFPFTPDGLQSALSFTCETPRSIIFVVGANDVCVPLSQAHSNGWMPSHG